MPLTFIHCSDLHLGKQRMGGKLPESDLADALRYIVRYTLEHNADGLLIAGDLFDTPNIQPQHLQMAMDCLAPLQTAGIPVFAIEGNHDRPFLSSESMTWVRYLNDQGYLHLLTIPFSPEGPEIKAWDPVTRRGSYIEYRGIRIMGAGYLGAGTIRRMRAVVETFSGTSEERLPTILLLHAGPEYLVHEGGGFDRETLVFLHEFTDYLALGHIHKPVDYQGWAINPGTAENIRLDEAAYDGATGEIPRGMAVVTIEPDGLFPQVKAAILPVPRRPVRRITLDCSGIEGRKAAGLIEDHIRKAAHQAGVTPEMVLQVDLEGLISLERTGLNLEALAAGLEADLPVRAVEIGLTSEAVGNGLMIEGEPADPGISRETLEREALRQLLAQSPLDKTEEQDIPSLVELMMDLKHDVRQQARPEEILDRLARHAVVQNMAGLLVRERESADEPQAEVAVAADGGGEA